MLLSKRLLLATWYVSWDSSWHSLRQTLVVFSCRLHVLHELGHHGGVMREAERHPTALQQGSLVHLVQEVVFWKGPSLTRIWVHIRVFAVSRQGVVVRGQVHCVVGFGHLVDLLLEDSVVLLHEKVFRVELQVFVSGHPVREPGDPAPNEVFGVLAHAEFFWTLRDDVRLVLIEDTLGMLFREALDLVLGLGFDHVSNVAKVSLVARAHAGSERVQVGVDGLGDIVLDQVRNGDEQVGHSISHFHRAEQDRLQEPLVVLVVDAVAQDDVLVGS
mmetsp:Transcript_5485/g.8564  ORF Transcript_5485/g.8564 Transcript_5485/m.8564 type:complete len:273 (-) Transcript_5485:244-1062(-)